MTRGGGTGGTAVVDIEGARKTYGRRGATPMRALDGLDLHVPAGGVHGFLGPNGSGKTTTIRALLGLLRVDSGTLRLLGAEVPDALPSVIAGVGALVESPLFFASFSGRLNLQLLAEAGGISRARVEECLEIVELRDRAGDRVSGYSLGMKQRLGIAAALLKEPSLLILDEPSNGLDPGGIRDVRRLVAALGADGHTTVLLSSHLLAEIEQVCDSVSIMTRGRCVATGGVREVLASGSAVDVRVRVDDPTGGRDALDRAGYSVRADGDVLVVDAGDDRGRISRTLGEAGHWVTEMTTAGADLESVFLALTEQQPVTGGIDGTARAAGGPQ